MPPRAPTRIDAVADAAARAAARRGAGGRARPGRRRRRARAGARRRRGAGAARRATARRSSARIAERSLGLGPLEPLLRDPAVDEILVSGTRPVWVERAGRLEPTTAAFASEADLRHAIERLLSPAGRRADEAEPLCDARLPDGSRVNVVLPPLAVDGPALTIRRFRPRVAHAGRARRARLLDAGAPRPAARRGRRPAQHPRLRRDGLGQDDDARRARGVPRRTTSGS